ncbi:MAG: autotransporter outer membrane beta-barrel domain-containing protein [Bacteroidaceae bacterium]|nr:autotransporter outer membrane beta-barrel domain-containing protein [Bacteroidaceae bacterium]
MKKITILFISFFMAQMAFAQFMPQQNQHMNIDPARLYLQKMGKGKKDRTSKQEEVLDPLTKRRRQMRSFVPQGNWVYGVSAGYLTMNSNHTDLVFNGMADADMRLKGFSFSPYMGYAVGNNSILGLRVGYNQLDGTEAFFPQYEEETLKHTFRNIDYTHTFYNVEAYWRGYVPIDNKLRWAFFTDVTLGYQGGSGYVLSDRDDVAYRSNFSLNQIRLGVRPGIAVALTNHVSIDLSVGLANVSYALQHEKNRDGDDIKENGFRINRLIDMANFQCGLTLNY